MIPNRIPTKKVVGGRTTWTLNGKRHRVDGPAIIFSDESEAWFLHDKLHRIDGPARTYNCGSERWFRHGYFHRVDGPAIVEIGGRNRWFLHGLEYYNLEQFAKDAKLLDCEILALMLTWGEIK